MYIFHNAAIFTDGKPIIWYIGPFGALSAIFEVKRFSELLIFMAGRELT